MFFQDVALEVEFVTEGGVGFAALVEGVQQDGFTSAFWSEPEFEEVTRGKGDGVVVVSSEGTLVGGGVALFFDPLGEGAVDAVCQLLDCSVARELESDFSEFGSALMLDVFEHGRTERDEGDGL